jgi:hypothetical protein
MCNLVSRLGCVGCVVGVTPKPGFCYNMLQSCDPAGVIMPRVGG